MKKQIKRWGPPAVLVILIGFAYAFDLHKAVTFAEIQARKEDFEAYVLAHPVLSVLIFGGLYAVAAALSLPIATLLTLLGGFLFGRWLGTLIVVTAATLGATAVFLAARTSVGQTLREKAGRLYTKIEDNMRDNAAGYMLFMRLVPLFPFFLVNIVPALFNMRTRTYIWTTFFGIIPGTFVYVNVGETLGEIDRPGDILSVEMLAAFGLLGLFALLPTVYKQVRGTKPPLSGAERIEKDDS